MSLTLILQVFILMTVVFGLVIFFIKKTVFDTTQGAVNRLNKETEDVRGKQAELNEKIKQANEELAKRRAEADALVVKMTEEAEGKAKVEKEKLLNKARAEAEEILSKAQLQKEQMRKVIEKEVRMETVDFTVEILDGIFSQKTKGAWDEQLVEDFLAALEKVDMDMIGKEVKSAEIITAVAINEKNKVKLSQIIKSKLNRDITIEAKIDVKLVSGALLRFGSLVLDGSLVSAIKEAGLTLKEKIEKS